LREYDYIFYVSPEGVELEDNGVRTIDMEYRKEIDKEIVKLSKNIKPKSPNLLDYRVLPRKELRKLNK
jgi:hypothetical protein